MSQTPCLAPEVLDGIRKRQERLKDSMQAHHVRHPADLPVQEILAHRAARLKGAL